MTSGHAALIDTEALAQVAERIRQIGVAGNEGEDRFEAADLKASLAELESGLKKRGYAGGSLAIETLIEPHDGIDVLVYDTDRFGGLADAQLAWEQNYRTRWRERIQIRVDNWLRRLHDLRTEITKWIEASSDLSELEIVDLPPARMFEELMQKFNVPPAEMPVFDLRAGARRVLRFQPKGLWIIGANGRVDLITRSASPILIDRSEPYASSPDWQLHDSRSERKWFPFNQETFTRLVSAGMA